jgi:hypothetical protein
VVYVVSPFSSLTPPPNVVVKPRALDMLLEHFTTEPHPQFFL